MNDGDKNTAVLDLDGTCGGLTANATIIAGNPFLYDEQSCQLQPGWHGAVCQPTVGGSFLRLRFDPWDNEWGGGATIYREDYPV